MIYSEIIIHLSTEWFTPCAAHVIEAYEFTNVSIFCHIQVINDEKKFMKMRNIVK